MNNLLEEEILDEKFLIKWGEKDKTVMGEMKKHSLYNEKFDDEFRTIA